MIKVNPKNSSLAELEDSISSLYKNSEHVEEESSSEDKQGEWIKVFVLGSDIDCSLWRPFYPWNHSLVKEALPVWSGETDNSGEPADGECKDRKQMETVNTSLYMILLACNILKVLKVQFGLVYFDLESIQTHTELMLVSGWTAKFTDLDCGKGSLQMVQHSSLKVNLKVENQLKE
ncbi:MAG: hypothetical protein ACI8P9_004421 [Parasphingorhabdus sp.]